VRCKLAVNVLAGFGLAVFEFRNLDLFSHLRIPRASSLPRAHREDCKSCDRYAIAVSEGSFQRIDGGVQNTSNTGEIPTSPATALIGSCCSHEFPFPHGHLVCPGPSGDFARTWRSGGIHAPSRSPSGVSHSFRESRSGTAVFTGNSENCSL
jgi:hypothetical protein